MFELSAIAITCALAVQSPPIVVIDRDDVRIAESCIIQTVDQPIEDANNNGVIHIVGDDLTIEFAPGAHLRGADSTVRPDQMKGIGITITGRNITLRGARISGFKVGLRATNANGLTIEGAEFDNNFRQHLQSNPMREVVSDWISPHRNDNGEWAERYGASLYVQDSTNVTIDSVRVRNAQNGIILDRVSHSRVYDCDASFLSGWGLALWRSNDNIISHSAFDFCIRGYSHGVYNRGQDSAGILLFEQCQRNIFAGNSATHGGDGIFAFSGLEALGDLNPRDDVEWYRSRGNNSNIFYQNDLSYAAAHGLEYTFGFDSIAIRNRFVGNAICGIWGGYSQRLKILENEFERNGDRGYGLERGGINIEHGQSNTIVGNTFRENHCGIHLWWDNDEHIFRHPWYSVNREKQEPAAWIVNNRFESDHLALHLRDMDRAVLVRDNTFDDVREQYRIQQGDQPMPLPADAIVPSQTPRSPISLDEMPGRNRPFGARAHLEGRHNIIMTEWGPWDHASPLVRRGDGDDNPHEHRWSIHGVDQVVEFDWHTRPAGVEARLQVDPDRGQKLVVSADSPGVHPYSLHIANDSFDAEIAGVLIHATWTVTFFNWSVDPREDDTRWRTLVQEPALADVAKEGEVQIELPLLKLSYGGGGPADVVREPVVQQAQIGRDRFGTVATTRLRFPPGRWRIRTVSDDGIRVWMNDELVVDDWTWHAPREHTHEFTLMESRDLAFRVEHFELDGHAVISLDVEFVSSARD